MKYNLGTDTLVFLKTINDDGSWTVDGGLDRQPYITRVSISYQWTDASVCNSRQIINQSINQSSFISDTRPIAHTKQAVGGRPPRYASAPCSWQYLRIYSPGGGAFRHNNIFLFIHQVAPVPACWLFKTSATSWPLTFWPWKWCPSHVWCGLPLCQF